MCEFSQQCRSLLNIHRKFDAADITIPGKQSRQLNGVHQHYFSTICNTSLQSRVKEHWYTNSQRQTTP